jgi:hypothetical protein
MRQLRGISCNVLSSTQKVYCPILILFRKGCDVMRQLRGISCNVLSSTQKVYCPILILFRKSFILSKIIAKNLYSVLI